MSSSNNRENRLLKMLRGARSGDLLGLGAVIVGLLLVVPGIVLQENFNASLGGMVRAAGGLLFLAGLAAILVVHSRRRAALLAAAGGIHRRYSAASANWSWMRRFGVALAAIGLFMIVPAIFLGLLFGPSIGSALTMLGIIISFCGIALLVCAICSSINKDDGRPRPWTRGSSGSRYGRTGRRGPSRP